MFNATKSVFIHYFPRYKLDKHENLLENRPELGRFDLHSCWRHIFGIGIRNCACLGIPGQLENPK